MRVIDRPIITIVFMIVMFIPIINQQIHINTLARENIDIDRKIYITLKATYQRMRNKGELRGYLIKEYEWYKN